MRFPIRAIAIVVAVIVTLFLAIGCR